jgi:hypothetical protein
MLYAHGLNNLKPGCMCMFRSSFATTHVGCELNYLHFVTLLFQLPMNANACNEGS